jgi:putative NADH-flavin reductase
MFYNMRVLIFGASGGTGRQLVKQAILQHHVVTAFVRSPADFGMAAANLAVFTGNVADAAAVARAMKNQDAVISALGVSRPLKPDPTVVQGIRHIIQAMEQSGVRRFIYQSFVGVTESRRHAGPFLRLVGVRVLRHEIADHETKEALVKASRLDWTIVRPPKLTNGAHTGKYRTGESIAARAFLPRLSRADAAEFLLRQLTDTAFVRKAISVMK